MQAVLLDDANDAPNADLKAGLAKFLRDDLDGGVRIEEAVADDLANDLVSADIVVFGSGLVALKSCASMFTIKFKQLKVSLLAEVKFRGGLGGAEPLALAFDEHSQAGDDEVIGKNREFSGGANDASGRDVELHGVVLRKTARDRAAGLAAGTPKRIALRRGLV